MRRIPQEHASDAALCFSLLQNWDSTLWPTIGFKNGVAAAAVLEVNPSTGAEEVVLDDSLPAAGGFTLELAFGAAQARLLILPGA